MRAKMLGLLLVAVLAVFSYATVAGAQTFRSGASAIIASGEKVDSTAWLSGENINVAGEVNGDLFCAGQNVTVSGRINGDVICAGQTVRVSGAVAGNVRVTGQTVSVSGEVSGNVSAGGQTVTIESGANVGRDASLAGQTVHINGQVGRDATISGTTALVSAPVARNVTAHVGSLSLVDSATIGGDLSYTAPKKMTKGSGAHITGNVSYFEPERQKEPKFELNPFVGIGLSLMMSAMFVVSAILLALIFPRALQSTTDDNAISFPRTLLAIFIGLVAGIVMPLAVIVLAITVLGIPFALILGVAWLLIVLLSGIFAAYYLGRVILSGRHNAILIMLIGSIFLAILLTVPVVNIFAGLLAMWYGTGAILLQLRRQYTAPRYTMAPAANRKRN